MNERPFTKGSFQAYLDEHKLMGSRCRTTGELYVPPRPLSPRTFSEDMEWVQMSGKGKLVAFTAVHIGPTAMIEAGYDRIHPYCSGIVELEEGPRISAQILGVDALRPESITIGVPVKVVFVSRGEGEERRTILAFEVAGQ